MAALLLVGFNIMPIFPRHSIQEWPVDVLLHQETEVEEGKKRD
jgi:hypothetical protein